MNFQKLKPNKHFIFSLFIAIGIGLLVSAICVLATDWTAPPTSPPTCPDSNPSCNTPLNVSAFTQYKAGALGIGGVFRAYSNAIFDGQVKITGGSPGAGKVLTSDANGLASWQDQAAQAVGLKVYKSDGVTLLGALVGIIGGANLDVCDGRWGFWDSRILHAVTDIDCWQKATLTTWYYSGSDCTGIPFAFNLPHGLWENRTQTGYTIPEDKTAYNISSSRWGITCTNFKKSYDQYNLYEIHVYIPVCGAGIAVNFSGGPCIVK